MKLLQELLKESEKSNDDITKELMKLDQLRFSDNKSNGNNDNITGAYVKDIDNKLVKKYINELKDINTTNIVDLLKKYLSKKHMNAEVHGKNETPGKCFRAVTDPNMEGYSIGYGFVCDKFDHLSDLTVHVFFIKDNKILEPSMMKGQTNFKIGAYLNHLTYYVLGVTNISSLNFIKDDDVMKQWKNKEIAIGKIASIAANSLISAAKNIIKT